MRPDALLLFKLSCLKSLLTLEEHFCTLFSAVRVRVFFNKVIFTGIYKVRNHYEWHPPHCDAHLWCTPVMYTAALWCTHVMYPCDVHRRTVMCTCDAHRRTVMGTCDVHLWCAPVMYTCDVHRCTVMLTAALWCTAVHFVSFRIILHGLNVQHALLS